MSTQHELEQLKVGGEFYFIHERDGEVLAKESSLNLFVNEGLVYALNSAFGVSVGGAPTPYANLYIGLAQANRAWQATDVAATINTVANEFNLYNSSLRPAWSPQALSTISSIELSDAGAEATYTVGDLSSVGGTANLYGAFLISASNNDGSSDATAVLMAGSNFPAPRSILQGDVFKVGYVLKSESGA